MCFVSPRNIWFGLLNEVHAYSSDNFYSYLVDLWCAVQIMASPAWLPQEVKPSMSQSPVSVSPASSASTQTSASLVSSVGPHTSNSSGGSTTDSIQEPLQAKFSNAPSFAVPTPSFSYRVPPNANISFGASQQSSPGSVSANLLMPSCIFCGCSYDLWI